MKKMLILLVMLLNSLVTVVRGEDWQTLDVAVFAEYKGTLNSKIGEPYPYYSPYTNSMIYPLHTRYPNTFSNPPTFFTCSAPSLVVTNSNAYICTGYTYNQSSLTMGLDFNGTSNQFVITLGTDSDAVLVKWHWVDAYCVSVTNNSYGHVDCSNIYVIANGTNSLTAVPNENCIFLGWTGDVDPDHSLDNPLSVVMNTNKNIVAHFRPSTISVSGNIIYTGVQTGTYYIVAVTNINDWNTNFYTTSSSGEFTITNLSIFQNYWLKAWKDSNGSKTLTYWEAQGIRSNEVCFSNYFTNLTCFTDCTVDVSNINVTLSNPTRDDDADGLPDWWEMYWWGNFSRTGTQDSDSDGLNNVQEYSNGTNPKIADTDGDGLNDAEEVSTYYTDPLNTDSDHDGMNDYYEVNYGFCPTNSADCLKIMTSSTSENQIVLTFRCINGMTYGLQSTTNLLNGWTEESILYPQSNQMTVTNTVENASSKFFRIVAK